MRIYVKEKNSRAIHIIIPTVLVMNIITSYIASFFISKYASQHITLSARDLRRIFNAVHIAKFKHPNWNLVEIDDADGDIVKIKL